jgi:hypothetical protein
MKMYWRVDLQLHAFLALALDGVCGQLPNCSDSFNSVLNYTTHWNKKKSVFIILFGLKEVKLYQTYADVCTPFLF